MKRVLLLQSGPLHRHEGALYYEHGGPGPRHHDVEVEGDLAKAMGAAIDKLSPRVLRQAQEDLRGCHVDIMGKSFVKGHWRETKGGKLIRIKPYTTKTPPGRPSSPAQIGAVLESLGSKKIPLDEFEPDDRGLRTSGFIPPDGESFYSLPGGRTHESISRELAEKGCRFGAYDRPAMMGLLEQGWTRVMGYNYEVWTLTEQLARKLEPFVQGHREKFYIDEHDPVTSHRIDPDVWADSNGNLLRAVRRADREEAAMYKSVEMAKSLLAGTDGGKFNLRELLAALRNDLAAEEKVIATYQEHAARASSPLVAAQLLAIADEERKHTGELLRLIEALADKERELVAQGKAEVENDVRRATGRQRMVLLAKSVGAKRKSEIALLKENRVPLTPEERAEVMQAKAVWHWGPHGEATPAIWKSKHPTTGVVQYFSFSRIYKVASTLKGAIGDFHKHVKQFA